MASNTRFQPYVLPKRPRFLPKRPIQYREDIGQLFSSGFEKYKRQPIEQNGRLLFQCNGNPSPHTIISAVILTIDPSNSTLDKFMEKDKCTQDILIDPMEPDEKIGFTIQKGKLLTQIVGYSFIVHLVKPITPDNKLYIHKRLNEIGHAINDPSLKNLDKSLVTALINIQTFNSVKDNLGRAGAIRKLLKDAVRMDTECEALMQATLNSFRKEFENHGMFATNHMINFYSKKIVTKALLIKEVLDECLKFKEAIDRFKAMHPDTWRFGRLLWLEGIDSLDNGKYPHLYTCALARAAGPQGTGLGNYKKSRFPLWIDECTLTSAALSVIEHENLKIGNHIKLDII